jgi:hypothetical protein
LGTVLLPALFNAAALSCVITYILSSFSLHKLILFGDVKGYDVLKRIADVIGQSDRRKLERLTG